MLPQQLNWIRKNPDYRVLISDFYFAKERQTWRKSLLKAIELDPKHNEAN